MDNDRITNILLVVVKKVNFIEILEAVCVMLRENEETGKNKETILNDIAIFLSNRGLEEQALEHFLTLVKALLGFYDFDELFNKNLSKMFIIINNMKMEAQELFSEFIRLLNKSDNVFHNLVYRGIVKSLNEGKTLYEIMIMFRNDYNEILNRFQESGLVVDVDADMILNALNDYRKHNNEDSGTTLK